jgi:hypothetical protein
MNRMWSRLLPVPLLPVLLWACSGEDGGPKGKGDRLPTREVYQIVGTTLSDTCFGETGSTLGGGTSDYGIFFEETDEGWSVLMDIDMPMLPCEGPKDDFVCTGQDEPETTTVPGLRTYTLVGSRDDETIEATFTGEITCEEGTTGCTPCAMEMEITGTLLEDGEL